MNYGRGVIAAIAATVVFFIYGFVVHGWLIAEDYRPYPEGVYRAGDAARTHMPIGLMGIFLAILVFTAIYAQCCQRESGAGRGARLGLLFGIFMVGAFVAVNYATINITGKLALEMAISEPIEWTLVGLVISLVYKPAASSAP